MAMSFISKIYSTFRPRFFVVLVITILEAAPAIAEPAATKKDWANFAHMSFEELAEIEITSLSKKPERLRSAPAAIYVITREDIRRSSAINIPELLRLAPNLQVAQVHAYGYAISARGFNSSSANKLLVLIDGRSVYSPLFSGVFWDVQDVMIEDIERIEVISGPGGTLWGTNAVNGIINIITRSAKDTQGGLIAAGGGTREANAAVRYGGALGAKGNYRVYGKYLDRNHTTTASGLAVDDASYKGQMGFQADWEHSTDQFTLQGNAYRGAEGQPLPGTISISGVNLALDTISISGANLTTRWMRDLEGGASFLLQAYYDRTERIVPPTFSETLDIMDVQFQHSLRPFGMHALTWGAEYRYGRDRVINSQFVAFLPENVNQSWTSLFAQDEMKLREDLRLTLGARIERNDYTGNEFLPNVRLAWTFSADHLLWTSASRTVRSPSRLDRDTFVPGRPPFLLAGGPEVRSEVANVYEIGYRGQPTPTLSYSATAFHADYDYLRTQEIAASRTFVFYANEMEGATSGVEIWGTYQASNAWRLSGGLAALKERLRLKAGSSDQAALTGVDRDPALSWTLRSSFDLPHQSELDIAIRHVSGLSNPAVPAYTAVDMRFGWRLSPNVEVSVIGQNLFDSKHAEFSAPLTRSEFRRSGFVKFLYHF
jgi:iron complex outermembrane recepter protein